MPELPDVEIFHRLVLDRCRSRTIKRALVNDPGILEGLSALAFERRLRGQGIQSSHRHGKHLFILLDKAGALAMHFGMNGSLQLVSKAGAEPARRRHPERPRQESTYLCFHWANDCQKNRAQYQRGRSYYRETNQNFLASLH